MKLTTIAICVLALFTAQAALAQAEHQTQSGSVPFAASDIPMICSDVPEYVSVEGTLDWVLRGVLTKNGMNAEVHVRISGAGTGEPSGAKYILGGEGNAAVHMSDAAQGYTIVLNIRLIGQGGAPDLKGHVNVHMTMNANGETTAEVLNYHLDCGDLTLP